MAGSLHITLKLNLEDCSLENKSGRWAGAADVAFVSQAKRRQSVGEVASKTVTFDLTDDAYLAHKRDGVTIEQTLEPNPKLSRIRVVVLDHRSGALRSLSLTPKA